MKNAKFVLRKSLRTLHYWFLKAHRRALHYPRVTIAIILVAVILGIPGLGRLQMLLVIDDLMDRDFATYSELQDLNQSFKDKNNVYLIARPTQDRAPNFAEICAVRRWVQRVSVNRNDIKKIVTSFGPARVEDSGDHLQFKPILDIDCGKSQMDMKTIGNQLQALRDSPWGMSLTGLDAKDIAVNFYLQDSEDHRFGSFDGTSVGELMNDFEHEVTSHFKDLKPHWSGVAVFQYYTKIGYDQTNLLNLLTFSVVLVLFRLIFGTFKSSILFLFTYVLTLLPMFSWMGFSGSPIDVLSNSLSLMMLIACVEDFLFVSYIRLRQPERSWRYGFRIMLLPSFFTSLTTAIGFGSLYASRLGIIRRFGAWAAFAAFVEWIMVFYFLPALLKLWPSMRAWANEKKALSFRFVEKLREMSIPPVLAKVSLVLFLVAVLGGGTLKVSDAPENVFPLTHPLRLDAKLIERTRHWIADTSLVFADADENEFNRSVIDKLSHDPLVAAIESPYEAAGFLRKGLRPYRADLVEQLWKLSSSSERLLDPNGLAGRAILYLNKTDIVDIMALRERVQAICGEHCHISGTLVSYGEFGSRVLSTFLGGMGLSLILVSVVVLFLGLALGTGNLMALLISMLWGPMVLLSLFVLFQVPLFYVTSIFASILVGMAGDNTIQFMFFRRSGDITESVRRLGAASILLVGTMCTLSCVLFLSYFTPLKILGMWMIFGLCLTLAGELWVLKALTKKRILPRLGR